MIKFNHLLFNEIKRTILSLVIAIIFISVKPFVPTSYQLLFFKIILVSLAFTHAHVAGKLAFPKCDWTSYNIKPIHIVRISLYAIFVISYSLGG